MGTILAGPDPRRVLFVAHACYLDDSNGASVASRALMRALARRGFAVEVLTGSALDLGVEVDLGDWLARRGYEPHARGGPSGPPSYRIAAQGVPVTVHRGPSTRPHQPDDEERRGFLGLLDDAMARLRPRVLVGYGGDRLAGESFAMAKARGVATAFTLHNFGYLHAGPFAHVDAILVASRFAADHHAASLGLKCTVLPYLVDLDRARSIDHRPRFATFVNPSREKGAYAFARIADELGRLRPDIPLLVVEGRGTARSLASCGLDLRRHPNLHVMAHTSDPRDFWAVTRLCLVPSLWRENQPLVAVEAMVNGIPVIASDRGGLPETLGRAGTVLPLPERITPATSDLPTAEEVWPWVEAIGRLWDDAGEYGRRRELALAEARRWDPDLLEPLYAKTFEALGTGRSAGPGSGR